MDGYIKKYRSWKKLIALFQSLKDSYETTDILLRSGIDGFCQILQNEHVIYSYKNTGGTIWGAKSLVVCFCEIFDPILIKIFPINSYASRYLQNQQISFPLLKYLQYKEKIKDVANSIDQVIIELESLIPFTNKHLQHASVPLSDWVNIQKDAENLQLLSRLLDTINSQIGIKRGMKWCSICFRMANTASDYCQIHGSKDDTAYRKALHVRKLIPFDLLEKFYRQNSKREALGDSFTIAAYSDELPAQVKPDTLLIYADKVIKDLVEDTQNLEWSAVSKNWDSILETVPHVSMRCERKATDFISWSQFVNYIKKALENHNDNTLHPYWIIMMLTEAENWLSFEEELAQKKVSPKKDQVIKLLAEGMRNCDIVNQLKVTNSYVSELRTKYNKNRTSN